jgi:hypothetical protein
MRDFRNEKRESALMTDKISDCVSELVLIAKGSGKLHLAQKHIERLLDEAEKQRQHRSGRFTEAQMLRDQLVQALHSHHGAAREFFDKLIDWLDVEHLWHRK